MARAPALVDLLRDRVRVPGGDDFSPYYYWAEPYLTPLASPLFYGEGPHALLGNDPPGWWPTFLPLIPGVFIALFPAGFRLTCYYYRGAYYKAFWADPPACAVGEPRNELPGRAASCR